MTPWVTNLHLSHYYYWFDRLDCVSLFDMLIILIGCIKIFDKFGFLLALDGMKITIMDMNIFFNYLQQQQLIEIKVITTTIIIGKKVVVAVILIIIKIIYFIFIFIIM